jgi:hypothetical protein
LILHTNGSKGSVAFNLERMNELEFYSDEGPNSGFKTIQATDPAHPYVKGWWPPGHIIGYEHTFTRPHLSVTEFFGSSPILQVPA